MLCAVITEAILIFILVISLLKSLCFLKMRSSALKRSRSEAESLRVINHDYKNKMHILMGHIETDNFSRAKQFINDVRTVPAEEVMRITNIIRIPSLSSLVIGKLIEAREQGISLNILPDSVCQVTSGKIPETDYITIIGNLLQNAIEELEMCNCENPTIFLFISTKEEWTLISVMDNGRGVPEDMHKLIFKNSYSTKGGTKRGLGLAAVKKIAEKHNGNVEIESEPGEGTEISVTMYGKPKG